MNVFNLEKFYGTFGTEIVSAIRAQMAIQGGLEPILKRLNVSVPRGIENQHKALRNFIFTYGVAFFLEAIRSNMTEDQIEIEKVRRIMPRSGSSGKSANIGDTSPGSSPASSFPGVPANPQLQQGYQQPRQNYQPSQPPPPQEYRNYPEHPYPAGEGGSFPCHEWIHTETYEGAERRSGIERRVGPADRRLTLEITYKNRRFGGRDRRKTIRRASDREKMRRK